MSQTTEATDTPECNESVGSEAMLTANNSNTVDGMSEPLIAGEGVPMWLNSILATFSHSSSMRSDAFIAALYVIMYECGFSAEANSPNNSYSYDINVMRKLTNIKYDTWKKDSNYQINFYLGTLPNVVKFIGIPIDNIMIINLHTLNKQVLTLPFKMNDYVNIENGSIIYSNLNSLSNQFKNACCEIRDNVLYENSLPGFNLTAMPYEILLTICSWLGPTGFVNLSLTCKHFYDSIYNDDSVWRRLTKKYLNVTKRSESKETWKKYFIKQRRLEKSRAGYIRKSYDLIGLCDKSPVSYMREIIL